MFIYNEFRANYKLTKWNQQNKVTYKFELSFLLSSLTFFEKVLASCKFFINLTIAITHHYVSTVIDFSDFCVTEVSAADFSNYCTQQQQHQGTLLSGCGGGKGVYGFLIRFFFGWRRLLMFLDLNLGRNRSHDWLLSSGSFSSSLFIISIYCNICSILLSRRSTTSDITDNKWHYWQQDLHHSESQHYD